MKWVHSLAGFSHDKRKAELEGEKEREREREREFLRQKVDSKVDNGQPSLSLFVTTPLSSTRDCVRLRGLIFALLERPVIGARAGELQNMKTAN